MEQGLTVANISATTFPQTLDWLHGYLLQVNFTDQFCIILKCVDTEHVVHLENWMCWRLTNCSNIILLVFSHISKEFEKLFPLCAGSLFTASLSSEEFSSSSCTFHSFCSFFSLVLQSHLLKR